jgi:hypothetical protein
MNIKEMGPNLKIFFLFAIVFNFQYVEDIPKRCFLNGGIYGGYGN